MGGVGIAPVLETGVAAVPGVIDSNKFGNMTRKGPKCANVTLFPDGIVRVY
jgi:hypothetical protein